MYLTTPGDIISKSALLDFRSNVLDRDDVFQPEFCSNMVYYGSEKDDLEVKPDALEQLAAWHTKTQTFVTASPGVNVAPGPYVITRGRTWQPWRIYYDINATVMTAFKPAPDGSGR